jgi:hypothetical protein
MYIISHFSFYIPHLSFLMPSGVAIDAGYKLEKAYHEGGINFFYWGAIRRRSMADAIRNLTRTERDRIVLALQSYDHVGYLMETFLNKGLRALKIDHADILILGGYNKVPSKRVLDEALRLKDRGIVRCLALSGHNRLLFGEIAGRSDLPIDLYMIRYNAAHRGAEKEIFPRLPRENRPGIRACSRRSGCPPVSGPSPRPSATGSFSQTKTWTSARRARGVHGRWKSPYSPLTGGLSPMPRWSGWGGLAITFTARKRDDAVYSYLFSPGPGVAFSPPETCGLPSQDRLLPRRSPAVIAEGAGGAYHPVARDEVGHGVPADGRPDGTGGAGKTGPPCQIPVRYHPSGGNPQKGLPDFDLKVRARNVQGQ